MTIHIQIYIHLVDAAKIYTYNYPCIYPAHLAAAVGRPAGPFYPERTRCVQFAGPKRGRNVCSSH